MDVHCSTYGESWDVYHLWHGAIFDTGLSCEESEAWRSLRRAAKLSDRGLEGPDQTQNPPYGTLA